MKKTITSILVFAVWLGLSLPRAASQNTFDANENRIAVGVAVMPESVVNGDAVALLRDKMNLLLTNNGLALDDNHSRFCVVVSMTPETKDVLPGPPPRIAQNFQTTFYLVDNLDRKIFSSTSLQLKGVDKSEEKCVINALRGINNRSEQLKRMIADGKKRIIDYYEATADVLVAQARLLAVQHRYEEALWLLSAVPAECPTAWTKAVAAGNEVFQRYVDYTCQVNLSKARMAWAAEQNAAGAYKAGEFLSTIYPEAACYGEADKLYREIKGKVLDDWKFEMKQYQDGVDLEKARIDAWRQVGIAYGNHQPQKEYQINWLAR